MMWYEKKNSAYDGDSDDCDGDTDDYDVWWFQRLQIQSVEHYENSKI